MRNSRLEKAQAVIKSARRSINNFRYAYDIILMAESKEELNSFLMKVKEESEKAGLKLSIEKIKIKNNNKKKLSTEKMKIMASGHITSWQLDGETIEIVTDFIFLCSQITGEGDCSHEIKRSLLLGSKGMINLDSILKSRNIINKGLEKPKIWQNHSQSLVFPVVMYGCESWNVKKAEN